MIHRINSLDSHFQDKSVQRIVASYTKNRCPLASMTEAISNQNILTHHKANELLVEIIKNIKEQSRQELAKSCMILPSQLISFFIPMEFYVPLGIENVPIAMKPDYINNILEIQSVSPFKEVMTFKNTHYRYSWLIITIGNNCTNKINSLCGHDSQVLELYLGCVKAINCFIGAYQAIPNRHNHNLRQVTIQSLPENINVILSDSNGKYLESRKFTFCPKTKAENVYSRPLTEVELLQFREAYRDKMFSNKKVFIAIDKITRATNERCFGHDAESICLANDFVELSANYLLYRLELQNGQSSSEVVAKCNTLSKRMDTVWGELAYLLLGTKDKNKIKEIIGHKEWRKYCRDVRNHLAHRLLMQEVNAEDSGRAVLYSGQLVKRLCDLALEKSDSAGLTYDLNLLKNSISFSETLLSGRLWPGGEHS